MKDIVKSFLIIGQSNMAGRGHLHEVKPIINERIVMLRNGRWQMMAEPINCDRSVSGRLEKRSRTMRSVRPGLP